MRMPVTQYAQNGDVNIAYQVVGKGPLDLALAVGLATHVEILWELPAGLSDRPSVLTTFEQQLDDLRAVLDTVGAERPALLGFTEGGPMSLLFAATYPERTTALVLWASYAKATRSADYPFGPTPEIHEMVGSRLASEWGRRVIFASSQAPSLAGDEAFRQWLWRLQRYAMSPAAAVAWYRMTTEIDIRHVLPLIRVPTLILHRTGDTVVDPGGSRYMAERIPSARYTEFEGNDNFPLAGNVDAILDEVLEFLTGARPAPVEDRVLATVMMTDIVGSTETAVRLGDRAWRDLLEGHHAVVRGELRRFHGREIDTAGDGFLATFDGPARAIRCAAAIVARVRALGVEVRIGLPWESAS